MTGSLAVLAGVNFTLDIPVIGTYKGESMLAAQKTGITQALRAKPIVVLAMLLLAAFQFTSATHQFDHTASELGDVCSFCLQLDRLDDVSAAESAEVAISNGPSSALKFTSSYTHVNRQYSSQPRAPPLS